MLQKILFWGGEIKRQCTEARHNSSLLYGAHRNLQVGKGEIFELLPGG